MSIENGPWTGFLPASTPETAPFWNAANEGVFLLQCCPDCGETQYHYRALCCHCWSDRIEDLPSSGRGTVWTYSVVYKNKTAGYVEKTPYVVGLVELGRADRVLRAPALRRSPPRRSRPAALSPTARLLAQLLLTRRPGLAVVRASAVLQPLASATAAQLDGPLRDVLLAVPPSPL